MVKFIIWKHLNTELLLKNNFLSIKLQFCRYFTFFGRYKLFKKPRYTYIFEIFFLIKMSSVSQSKNMKILTGLRSYQIIVTKGNFLI